MVTVPMAARAWLFLAALALPTAACGEFTLDDAAPTDDAGLPSCPPQSSRVALSVGTIRANIPDIGDIHGPCVSTAEKPCWAPYRQLGTTSTTGIGSLGKAPARTFMQLSRTETPDFWNRRGLVEVSTTPDDAGAATPLGYCAPTPICDFTRPLYVSGDSANLVVSTTAPGTAAAPLCYIAP